ncbi:MAG: hypothetical protein K6U02_08040, partial [Firmicutes bacterium]|nr:hypothetical protein [Bacillota bacterium]
MHTRRARVWLWAALAAVLVVLLLSPVLYPLCWRLFHPTRFEQFGWQVQVPAGWYVVEREPNLVLARLPWLYPLRNAPASYIVIVENLLGDRLSAEVHWARWREISIQRERASGSQLVGERELTAGVRLVRCLEFVAAGETDRVRVE